MKFLKQYIKLLEKRLSNIDSEMDETHTYSERYERLKTMREIISGQIEDIKQLSIASSDRVWTGDDFNVGCGDVIRLINSEYAYCGKEYSGGKKYYCKVCEEKLKLSLGSKAIES